MRLRVLVVAAVLMWPVFALSQERTTGAFGTGNMLYETCGAHDIGNEKYCLAYAVGATDAFAWDGKVCPPRQVTEQQVRDIVVGYLRDHPELRHYSAPSIASRALEEAFPCKEQAH